MDKKNNRVRKYPCSTILLSKEKAVISLMLDTKDEEVFHEIVDGIFSNTNLLKFSSQNHPLMSVDNYKDSHEEISFFVKNKTQFYIDFNGYVFNGKVYTKIDPKIRKTKEIGFSLTFRSNQVRAILLHGIRNISKEKLD